MSYKITDGGFCVDKGIDDLERAKTIAEDYARDADIDTLKIEDESTGETVATGHATLVMEWKDGQ